VTLDVEIELKTQTAERGAETAKQALHNTNTIVNSVNGDNIIGGVYV
jgi:hypothetical protein